MRIINPSYEILTPISEGGIKELKLIEEVARECYKSTNKITPEDDPSSAISLIKGQLIPRHHEAMLEHGGMTVKFVVDRGVTHEMVRHRLASFAQESTRYCNYAKDKFNNEITVIKPLFFVEDSDKYNLWYQACSTAEKLYLELLDKGATPQQARSVLPNSTKSVISITANWREWRTIFKLRCASDAHPQMREVMIPLLIEMKTKIPVLFDDINVTQ